MGGCGYMCHSLKTRLFKTYIKIFICYKKLWKENRKLVKTQELRTWILCLENTAAECAFNIHKVYSHRIQWNAISQPKGWPYAVLLKCEISLPREEGQMQRKQDSVRNLGILRVLFSGKYQFCFYMTLSGSMWTNIYSVQIRHRKPANGMVLPNNGLISHWVYPCYFQVFYRSKVTQRGLYQDKAYPSSGADAGKLHPQHSLQLGCFVNLFPWIVTRYISVGMVLVNFVTFRKFLSLLIFMYFLTLLCYISFLVFPTFLLPPGGNVSNE